MARAVARQGSRKGDFLGGKYLLGDCLGIGGMGEVYSATNVLLGRNVAIKILSRDFAKNEDDVLRFLREARAAAAVRHPNVVDVLDVARDDDGTPFIVQELLSGRDLEQHLQACGHKMSVDEVLEVMIPVADAVAAAHARAVVHRDLKPANIFLAREGMRLVPKVLDFGACLYKTVGGVTTQEQRMLIGTPHYMAPEQISSKADVDQRSDVWALGVILYELLVGETPFEAETGDKVMRLVKTREVPPLRSACPLAPLELERVIARCTHRQIPKRLPDASAVRDELMDVRALVSGSARHAIRARGSAPEQDANELPTQPPPPTEASEPAPVQRRGSSLLTLSEPDARTAESDPTPAPPASTQRPIEAATPVVSFPTMATMTNLDPDANANTNAITNHAEPGADSSEARDGVRSSLPPVLFEGTGSGARDGGTGASSASGPAAPASVAGPASTRTSQRWSARDMGRDANPSHPPGSRPSHPEAAPASQRLSRGDIAPMSGGPRSASSSQLSPSPPRAVRSRSLVPLGLGIVVPVLAAFATLHFVTFVTAPLARAIHGDSPVASGIFTIVALVVAAALARRAMQSPTRSLLVATVSSVVLGIVMIIVTFSASEAAELGIPSAAAGLVPFVAPLAPLGLAFGWFVRAREAWERDASDERRELFTAIGLTGLLLLFALELGPAGAVVHPTASPRAPTQEPSPP